MKILILTQILDKEDSVLGFFHDWIIEFSKKFEKVTIICLKMGKYDLPDNVQVFSLGKEAGESRLKYIKNFYKYIISSRKEYDCVFVHMTQLYVLMGAIVWKMFSKKIYLWYAHGKTSLSLKLADCLVDRVFTSSANGYRLNSKKISIVGQGINIEQFNGAPTEKQYDFIHVGRISKIKNIEKMCDCFNAISSARLLLIGEPITEDDKNYFLSFKDKLKNNINYLGPIEHKQLNNYYNQTKFFISLSMTGSLDKTVLEAMSAGLIPLVSNIAFREDFKEMGIYDKCFLESIDQDFVLNKMGYMVNLSVTEYENISKIVSNYVRLNHSLESLIGKIKNEITR